MTDPTLSTSWVRQWLMEAAPDFDRGEFMDHVERVVTEVAAAARREGAAEVGSAVEAWASKNEIAAPPLALLTEHRQAVHGPRNGPAWYVVCKCKWQDEWPDIEVKAPERVEDWFVNDGRYDECHERANARHRRHQAEVISDWYAERIAQARREAWDEGAAAVDFDQYAGEFVRPDNPYRSG